MDPRDRIAVVTGAAGGIGGALVRALVDAGARAVVATDVRAESIAAGDRIVAFVVDIDKQKLEKAPSYDEDDFRWTPDYGRSVDRYYGATSYWS